LAALAPRSPSGNWLCSPWPFTCPIPHNSVPAKRLSFIRPRHELALFRTLIQAGLSRRPVGPRPFSDTPREIGFVLHVFGPDEILPISRLPFLILSSVALLLYKHLNSLSSKNRIAAAGNTKGEEGEGPRSDGTVKERRQARMRGLHHGRPTKSSHGASVTDSEATGYRPLPPSEA